MTILSLSLPDRRCFKEEEASTVGEVGQEDPIVGLEKEEVTKEMLVAGKKNEMIEAEGST